MDKYLESIVNRKDKSKDLETEVTASNYVQQNPYLGEEGIIDVFVNFNDPSPNKHELEKMFVYPEQDWQNPDWAGGNFQTPYNNHLQKEMNQTDNSPMNLYDPMKGASVENISDLTSKSAYSVDSFLSDSTDFIKVSSMDLEQFMKVSDDTLIHKSNKDLWNMVTDKEGNVYISRLFDAEFLEEK